MSKIFCYAREVREAGRVTVIEAVLCCIDKKRLLGRLYGCLKINWTDEHVPLPPNDRERKIHAASLEELSK